MSREDVPESLVLASEPAAGHVGTAADEILPKLPFFAQAKDTGYFAAFTQIAIGVMYALYIMITQWSYAGKSFKYTWDNLDVIWHFRAVPGIGNWAASNWDTGRHLFLRDTPETIVVYALVVLVLVKVKPLKDRTPLLDKILIAVHAPSPYQGRHVNRWGLRAGQHRHADTSPVQFLLLVPAMILLALPLEIIAGAAVFGGMALAHRHGYHAGWLNQDAAWVPIIIGIAGGVLGHRPAVKPGLDVQRYYLRRRLSVAYAAEEMLDRFRRGLLTRDEARDQLTAMRSARPGEIYPAAYQARYDSMLSSRVTSQQGSRVSSVSIRAALLVGVVLCLYGLYAKYIGIPSGHLWKL